MTLMATHQIPGRAAPPSSDGCRPQRVLVVDERELMQAGLRSVLLDAPWVRACFVARSADDALAIARRCQPQVVLVSTSLEGRSGPELCRAFRRLMPHVKVVLMSEEGRVPAPVAQSLGAVAALSKHMPGDAVVSAVKHVAEGAKVFPRSTSIDDLRLSRRESDVLQHVASGLSNPEVAEVLNLSRHTVKQHTSAVYRKLGVRNRAEAASRALELGLLSLAVSEGRQQRAG